MVILDTPPGAEGAGAGAEAGGGDAGLGGGAGGGVGGTGRGAGRDAESGADVCPPRWFKVKTDCRSMGGAVFLFRVESVPRSSGGAVMFFTGLDRMGTSITRQRVF